MSIYQRAAPAEGSPAGWAATHCWQADKNVECMVSAASSRSCTVIVALSPHGPHVGNGASACWPCWSCCTLDLVTGQQHVSWQGLERLTCTAFKAAAAPGSQLAMPAHMCICLSQAINEAGTHIALGCCGTSLSLWQLGTHAKVWQAKGPKRNRIGLVDKPWDTAVAFLPGSQGQRLIAGTAFGKLRTFVTSHKRATREVVSEESRITALAPTADGEQCTGRHRC